MTGGRRSPEGEGRNVGGWGWTRPSTTIVGKFSPHIVSPPGHRDRSSKDSESRQDGDGVRITLREALILQSFPEDYPLQGSRSKCFEQVGNAVPLRLAMHALASLLGIALPVESEGAA